MTARRSIFLPSFQHANPIPAASLVGPFLFTGAITGKDPETGTMPATLEEQCKNVFAHISSIAKAAEASTDDIGKITFHLVDYRDRAALNERWKEMFPDSDSMPARQVLAASLDGGALIHADFIAVVGR